MEVLREAHRAKNEEALFNRWVISYQSTMSFAEFKQKAGAYGKSEQDAGNETEEEILRKVKGILNGNF